MIYNISPEGYIIKNTSTGGWGWFRTDGFHRCGYENRDFAVDQAWRDFYKNYKPTGHWNLSMEWTPYD